MAPTGPAGFYECGLARVISPFLQNDHYASREDYLAALADAMKAEYETIVGAGLDELIVLICLVTAYALQRSER